MAAMRGFHQPDRQFRPAFAGALRPSHDEAAGGAATGRHRRCGAFNQPAARTRREHGAAGCSGAQPRAGADEQCRGAVLEAYARARRWHVRVFQALSLAFTPFYQSDSVVLPFIRDRLVATVAKIPPAPQLLASMVAGTVIDPFRRIGLREANWLDREAELSCRVTAPEKG